MTAVRRPRDERFETHRAIVDLRDAEPVLDGYGFRAPAAASGWATGQISGAAVAKIGNLRAAAGIRKT